MTKKNHNLHSRLRASLQVRARQAVSRVPGRQVRAAERRRGDFAVGYVDVYEIVFL